MRRCGEVFANRDRKFVAVSLTAARVREEDAVPLRREPLELEEEGVSVRGVRAAVNLEEQGVLAAGIEVWWAQQPSVDGVPFGTSNRHELWRGERVVGSPIGTETR